MSPSPHARRSRTFARFMQESDAGGILGGFLLAVLVVALIGVAAFYYFGGRADVNVKIKKSPNITVSGSPSPS